MASLLTIVRDKYLDAIRSVQPPGKWKALVVDDHSKRLLAVVLKNNDILAEKVTAIEDISTNREPQPQLEAIYLVMPTTKIVDRIISDYSNGNQQYKRAHLFFIDGLSDDLFNRLATSPAEPHLESVKDLQVNFWPLESQVFSTKLPELFFSIYAPPRTNSSIRQARDRLQEQLRFTSTMITNVCITLGEFPYIRYYLPSHHAPLGPLAPAPQAAAAAPPPPAEGSGRWRTNLARGSIVRDHEAAEREFATKILAFMVQDALEKYKNTNPDFPKPSDPPRPRATLIITDRTMDPISPFVHEFTYQAMANDLLKIEDGATYTFKIQSAIGGYEDQTAVLSDVDTVWTDVRHMHMREAIDKLMSDFNSFLQEHAGFKGEGLASLNDMKDMLASLPQYQEQREKFSVHLNMAQECMDAFERRKLTAVANVEQICATGVTAEGKSPKTLVEEMVPLLDSKEVINRDKVRIISLYILHRDGVPDEDRRRLYQHARLSVAEQDAVNSLVHLGVRISRGSNDKDTKKTLKSKSTSEDEYELSRWKPLLQTVLNDQVNNRLDASVFPYVKDTPSHTATSTSLRAATPTQPTSLRSAKPSWHKAARVGSTTSEVKQRLLVFIAGGMTYSEMRTVYQLSRSQNKDIIIGSTHVVSPEQFIDDLKVLELGGVGSKANPNGIHEMEGGPRSFQEYYDKMYFTKDPPPPRLRPPPGGPPMSNDRTRSPRPMPSPAPSSIAPSASMQSNLTGKSEKKKKGKFFGF